MRSDLRARAEHEELTAPETVEHEFTEAKVKFESLGAPPAETVRDSERVLRANVRKPSGTSRSASLRPRWLEANSRNAASATSKS